MSSAQRGLLIGGAVILVGIIGLAIYSGTKTMPHPEPQSQNNAVATPPANPASEAAPVLSVADGLRHIITLKTSMGDIRFGTYDTDAPKTVQNFITLAQKGFYKNLTFHRLIKGFMIQGGDPKGDGTGGPGYTFADELNPNTSSYREGYKKGVVAMANAGPKTNTNGSQFFIMLEDTPLPHDYTIFGKVISGQDVVDAIGSVRTGRNNRPLEPVIIKDVKVEAVSR